ncbi:hypothetical protein BJX99DRAFT_270789, partial [Aspergillus californicus]
MFSLRSTLLALMATTGSVYAEHLRVVFSSGSFNAIQGGSGNYNGFAIINDDDVAIYDNGYPNDHAPCYHQTDGRTFTIEGDCWGSARTFNCYAGFDGSPESCSVKDADGNELGSGEGQSDTTFIGISIGTDASCVVEFDSDDVEGNVCPEDDGDGPLHVTSG